MQLIGESCCASISHRRGHPQNTLDLIVECALFILGLAFGSFLNVCISRIPREQSIVTPGSHCATCGASIRWYDNIPLLSWMFLHGRCRACGTRISLRYPSVELLTAILFTACYVWFGPTWITVKFCVFSFLLVGLLFMDAETGFLPREFTYPGIALGLAFSWIAPTDSSGTLFLLHAYDVHLSTAEVSFLDSMAGTLFGAGFFFVAAGLYFLMRKRQGMGTGDFALIAMAGAFLGLKLTLLVIFLAPILATVYALILIGWHATGAKGASASLREMLQSWEIPFGVFLSSASLAVAFFGEKVWSWYLSRF
jgi:leader peptidase (prepilin peptidase) / N-methyltransferase